MNTASIQSEKIEKEIKQLKKITWSTQPAEYIFRNTETIYPSKTKHT